MYYETSGTNEPLNPEPKQNGKTIVVILITVVATLALIGVLFGAFLWGQNSGKNSSSSTANQSNSKSNSLSNNSSGVSSSSTATSPSASSSSSSVAALTTYTDTDYTNVSLKYDSTWTLSIDKISTSPFKSKKIILTKTGNGSKLTVALDNAGRGAGGFCLSADQIVDIGSEWNRMKVDTLRYFDKSSNIDFVAPFPNPVPGSDTNCPASTTAVAVNVIDIPDTAVSGAYIAGITLELVGEDRAVADDVVKTISY